LALYAPAVFFDGLVQKSVLDVFLVCLLLAQLAGFMAEHPHARADVPGAWRWLGVGATLGALSLTRENALIFVPVLLGWIWWQVRTVAPTRVHMTAALLAGLGIALVPVGVRNRLVGGEFHLTTAQSGPNFFIGNNPAADGTYIPLRFGRGSPEY